MDIWHTGTGIIEYDPWRADMNKRTTNWCVMNVDREITRYYREWMRHEKHIHLQPPSWDAHISIVRGELLTKEAQLLWGKHNKIIVPFKYKHVGLYTVATSGLSDNKDRGLYYLVEVHSPMLHQIRKELGLRSDWEYHLTFGRIYTYEARVPKR